MSQKSDAGKGSIRRPRRVSIDIWEENYLKVFKKKEKVKEKEQCDNENVVN